MAKLRSIVFATVLLTAYVVSLGAPAGAAADSRTDGIEHIFGATNVHAITGHGRLSVGVSAQGDVTVLTWPNPSVTDQLAYATSNAVDARSMERFGAPRGAGMFLGLLVEHGDGSREVTWLRNAATWSIDQTYGPEDGANPHTVHVSESLGLTVTVVDAVAPRPGGGPADLFVRDVTVERDAESSVESAWLLTYANLSPVPPNARIAKIPVADWVFDGRNDFAAVWDESASAVMHFHPNDQRVHDELADVINSPDVAFGPVGEALTADDVGDSELASLASSLDESYAEGAYLALTSAPAPDQHHVGFDETPWCEHADELAANLNMLGDRFPSLDPPVPPDVTDVLRCDPDRESFRSREGWSYDAPDALADASDDGELAGGGIAAGEVNEALRTPLSFTDGDGGTATATAQVLLGAGPTAADARGAVSGVSDPAAVDEEAATAVADWLEDRRIPGEESTEVRRVARRALINVRVGTDARTGAVVASISRQPPYGLDWPRDGAFFNVLLDASGQHELVAKRNRLYAEWQRKESVMRTVFVNPEPHRNPDGTTSDFYPPATWEMNYYPDGTAGGVYRFEIDNAGFAVWAMVAHVGWVPEGERESYLRSVWDAVERGADFLAEWRDPETGLQARAQEDDNPGYVQTIHGAVTTYGALDIASRAARMLGETEAAERWEQRAGELRDAILFHLYDDEAGRFVREAGDTFSGDTPTGPTAWLVWPMTLLPLDDQRMQSQVRVDLDAVRPTIELETEGGAYFMKNTASAGVAQLGAGDGREALHTDLEDLLGKLAGHATPGTDHFGESMVVVEEGGEPRASQRVANPHLWEGTLFYLTALAVEEPGALTAYDDVLPDSQVPEPGTVGVPMPDGGMGDAGATTDPDGGSGCGCVTAGRAPGTAGGLSVAAVAVAGIALRRIRRRPTRAGGRRRRARTRRTSRA